MTERIICSAIWYKDLPTQRFLPINTGTGMVVCGHRHGHCIDVVKMLSGLRTVQIAPDGVGDTTQGFLTSANRFVDREEAWIIAKREGQIQKQSGGYGRLYSEDLY